MNKLHVYPNNNLSNFSNGIFISDQSLDIITKTGNYRGANISELVPYITPSSWCGIKAYVQSDNAAFFNIITSDNIVINAYRDGDGTYKIYPLALKSDLSQNIIAKTFNAQVTVKANEGYICDVPFTVPAGYELLDVVDTYIVGTPAALSQQGIVENKVRVYIQPFYGGSGNVNVKILFKKKS